MAGIRLCKKCATHKLRSKECSQYYITEEAIKKAFNVAFKEMTNGIEQRKDQVLKSIKLSNTDRTDVQVQADIERAQADMINLYHKKDEVDDYTAQATKIAARIDQLVKEKEKLIQESTQSNLADIRLMEIKKYLYEKITDEFNENLFNKLVEHIVIRNRYDLEFHFKTGTIIRTRASEE